jgi:hypothetical protein
MNRRRNLTAAQRRALAARFAEASACFLAHPNQRLYQRVTLACALTGLAGSLVWQHLSRVGLIDPVYDKRHKSSQLSALSSQPEKTGERG